MVVCPERWSDARSGSVSVNESLDWSRRGERGEGRWRGFQQFSPCFTSPSSRATEFVMIYLPDRRRSITYLIPSLPASAALVSSLNLLWFMLLLLLLLLPAWPMCQLSNLFDAHLTLGYKQPFISDLLAFSDWFITIPLPDSVVNHYLTLELRWLIA